MGVTFKNFTFVLFCAAVLSACAFPLPLDYDKSKTLPGVLQSVGDAAEAEPNRGGGGYHN